MSKIAVNEITDEVGTGGPSLPNGMSATGAALTDPQITGGIFLGGTGSANKLDDYEEGTWTPVAGDSGTTYNSRSGTYTKIGNVVYFAFGVSIDIFSLTGDQFRLKGLPFRQSSTAPRGGASLLTFNGGPSITWATFLGNPNSTNLLAVGQTTIDNNDNFAIDLFTDNSSFDFFGFYYTDD